MLIDEKYITIRSDLSGFVWPILALQDGKIYFYCICLSCFHFIGHVIGTGGVADNKRAGLLSSESLTVF